MVAAASLVANVLSAIQPGIRRELQILESSSRALNQFVFFKLCRELLGARIS